MEMGLKRGTRFRGRRGKFNATSRTLWWEALTGDTATG
jgi:hypothetical protein